MYRPGPCYQSIGSPVPEALISNGLGLELGARCNRRSNAGAAFTICARSRKDCWRRGARELGQFLITQTGDGLSVDHLAGNHLQLIGRPLAASVADKPRRLGITSGGLEHLGQGQRVHVPLE